MTCEVAYSSVTKEDNVIVGNFTVDLKVVDGFAIEQISKRIVEEVDDDLLDDSGAKTFKIEIKVKE